MADRGKWAEAEVRKVLSALEGEVAGFAFNRIPDAKGGFLQPADADFQWFLSTGRYIEELMGVPYTRNAILEVKEVEHLHLLPHKNFSSDKIARGWRRQMAGCEARVYVAHKLKGMRKPDVTWRCVPLQFFRDTEYVKGVGSWDLRQFPLVDMEDSVRTWIKEGR
jgi:hypothetical protein